MSHCYYYDSEEGVYIPMLCYGPLRTLEEEVAALSREVSQLKYQLAINHSQIAWMNSRITQQSPLQHVPPPVAIKRVRIQNKKLANSVNSHQEKMDKSQQTEILPQKIDKGQQTEASIPELKETNRKTIEELLPAMREPLQRCTNTIDETMLYFEALMGNHKATTRPHLQDAIVLSMVEKHGCKNRKAFEEGLQEIFGDWFELWRSRLYNSFFHTVHENKIPSFGKKRRKRKTKSNGTDAPNVIPNQV
jgi:hypothetical protein